MPAIEINHRLSTAKELSEIFKVHLITVYKKKWQAGVGLTPIKLGSRLYFDTEEVEQILTNACTAREMKG